MRVLKRKTKNPIQKVEANPHLTVTTLPNAPERLEIGNLILCIIRCARDEFGIAGESTLQYLVYKILGYPEFEELDKKYPFELYENHPYSIEIHSILKKLSVDMSTYQMNPSVKDNTAVIMSDTIRSSSYGVYEETRESEKWMDKVFNEKVEPTFYAITLPGVGIAEYSWDKLLNQPQRDIIDTEVKNYYLKRY